MKDNINSGRRSFTIGAAAGLGAVVSGMLNLNSILAQDTYYDNEKKVFVLEPNIWLEIKKDNSIVITIPRSELGQGVRTSLSMIVAEELDADWEKIEAVNAVGDAKYSNQSTGGSTSIRVFWNTLRTAGAQARMMLVSAAALTWGIPEANCRTENGVVYEKSGSRSLTYGDLIDKASTLPIPPAQNVKLKNPADFKIIGKTKWHIDNPDIVTGKAVYGSDFRFEGMKYAVIIRCPEIGGSLKSFKDADARKIAGFIATYQLPEGIAVVADSTYTAIKSAEKVNVEWNLSPISNKNSKIIAEEMKAKIGKLPDLPADTIKEITSVYEVPLLAHATMEPMNSFAHFKNNKCEIWTITQNPQFARTAAAKALNIPESDVTVNVLMSGGGFGRGHRNDFVAIAAQISKLSGYPVKFLYTKSDDIKNDFFRPLSTHAVKSGLDSSGKISGWIQKVISQGTVKATNPYYNMPNTQNLDDSISYSISTGSWRSVNNTQNVFVNECMIDELAHLAGKDALEFRLSMEMNFRLRGVLNLVTEKADWKKPLPKNWGRGLACFNDYGSFAAHVVEVSIQQYGILKIERIVAAVDCGIAINPGNIENQFIGGAIDALSTAIKSEITIKNGRIEQSGFHDYEWLTMRESPKIEVHIMPSAESPGGIGEVGFPSVSPALCNAIFNATGIRVRRLPIKHTSLINDIDESDATKDNSIKIYPMPFDNELNIEINSNDSISEAVDIKIYDILGNVIYTSKKNIINGKLNEKINLSSVNSGTYTFTARGSKTNIIRKIIK